MMQCPVKKCDLPHEKMGDDFSRWEQLIAAGVKLHPGGHHFRDDFIDFKALADDTGEDLAGTPLAFKIKIGAFDAQGFYTDERTASMVQFYAEEENRWKAEMRRTTPRTRAGWEKLMGISNPFAIRPKIDVDELKRGIDFAALLERYGVKVKTKRRRQVVPCAFHEDRIPSMSVDLDEGLWNCMAGCGGGDAISFVMRSDGLSFKEAISQLATL